VVFLKSLWQILTRNNRSPCHYFHISRSSSSGRLEQYVQILADLGKTRASADVQQRLLTLVTVLVGQTIHHRDQLQGMSQLFINTTYKENYTSLRSVGIPHVRFHIA